MSSIESAVVDIFAARVFLNNVKDKLPSPIAIRKTTPQGASFAQKSQKNHSVDLWTSTNKGKSPVVA